SLGRIAEVGDLVQLEWAFLEVLEMDNHRITKVLFQHQITEELEEAEPEIEEKKTNRSFLKRSSEKTLKDIKDRPEVQEAEAEAATEKETDSNVKVV
ncbi:MAG: hypothetical protein KZQ79_06165, partial [Candidatus Thiodiazotropha sp. (ex Lucinoma borealis)]|nr:hypothetical protein [Candidatus Thiodiazotropha sp. (ex Lucinoma borealis)]